MDSKNKIEKMWRLYDNFKQNAEQHMFVQLLLYDRILIPAYNDLQKNFNEKHAEIFIKGMVKVFNKLGIKYETN